jgi:hypothetical protein
MSHACIFFWRREGQRVTHVALRAGGDFIIGITSSTTTHFAYGMITIVHPAQVWSVSTHPVFWRFCPALDIVRHDFNNT